VFKPEEQAKKINILTLSVLGYSLLHSPCPETPPHILDVLHFYVNSSVELEEYGSEFDIDITQIWEQQLTLKRCALSLITSGVAIDLVLFLVSIRCGRV
jgi:hypothetical protein